MLLSRRRFLRSASIATAAAPGLGQTPRASRRPPPNIVYIMSDDQGYGDLACHGNPVIHTPHLDRLHGESLRLENFHVSPTCAPTRSALMTGRYTNLVGPWHTIQGRSLLHRDETTMADCLKAAGYRTGIFGKWHLGDNYPFRPQDRGFEETLVCGGGGVWQTPDHFGNDYFDDTYLYNGRLRKVEGFCTDVFFGAAEQFIEAATRQGKPFFCYIAPNAPHGPMWGPGRNRDRYQNVPGLAEPDFYGMIENLDENIGRLRAFLETRGLDQNTIFVFTTDNGTSSGQKVHSAGMRAAKGSPYEGGHRVPFFLHWPAGGYREGRGVNMLAAHIDILPTLLEFARAKHPSPARLHGQSLVPFIAPGAKMEWPNRTLVTDSQRGENLVKWRQAAVMTQRYRLVSPGPGGQPQPRLELYDIAQDPGQRNDIASSHPKIVDQLRADYERWWTTVSARGNEYARIILGDARENPSRLTAHDWHGEGAEKIWNQRAIRQAPAVNGFWAVETRAGRYRFELRRWPEELNLALGAPFADASPNRETAAGRAVPVAKARLRIGAQDRTIEVKPTDTAAIFELTLPAGPAELQTWLISPDGAERGAYYVYARRL